ncbi:MAG TPA: ATP-binding protein [Clostridia bacterium]|nr:ATP-binding protein [Clostridia bacterium]
MARSDLLVSLVEAATEGDQSLLRKTVEAIISEERAKQHVVLAERLRQALDRHPNPPRTPLLPLSNEDHHHSLFYELVPRRSLAELILPENVSRVCLEIIEEQRRADLLRSYNLEPRHRILLAGPPGNGKTSLAEAIAEGLSVPLITVSYEGVIASYLGETAQRLKRLFDYVRTRQCVLFFDEFDVVGKERGDPHDSGEIKRLVSSLLLQVDGLPSYVVTIAATNHPELLDRAVWRRFQVRLYLPPPGVRELEKFFARFQGRLGVPLGYTPHALAQRIRGLSYAEAEDFCSDIHRRYILSLPNTDLGQIVSERLEQWKKRYHPSQSSKGGRSNARNDETPADTPSQRGSEQR